MAKKAKKKWYSKQHTLGFVRKPKGRWRKPGKQKKRYGQPLVAFRADRALIAAFIEAKGGREEAWASLRATMARAK